MSDIMLMILIVILYIIFVIERHIERKNKETKDE